MADYSKSVAKDMAELKQFMVNSFGSFMQSQKENSDKQTRALMDIGEYLKAGSGESGGDGTGKSFLFGNLSKFFKNLQDLSKGTTDLKKALKGFEKLDTEKLTTFFTDMTKALTLDGKYEKPNEIADLYEKASQSLINIGRGLLAFSTGVIAFAPVSKLGLTKVFFRFTEKFFSKSFWDQLEVKKAKKGGEALLTIGRSLKLFATSLAISGPLMILGIPSLILALPVIGLTMLTFKALSIMGGKASRKSAEAMKHLSMGLLFFSGALVVMRLVQPMDMVKALGVIAVFSAFYALATLISKIGGKKNKATASMLALSFAFGMFTLSIIATKAVEWKDIGKAAAITGLMSLLLLVSGYAGGLKSVVTLIALSAAFAAFALSTLLYKSIEWEDIGKAGAVVGGAVGIALLLGATNVIGLIGAGVLVAIGASFMLFGLAFYTFIDSLSKFKKLNWGEEDTANLVGVVSGLIIGIGNTFRGGGMVEGFKRFVSGGAGIALLVGLGPALTLLSNGLTDFRKLNWTPADSEQLRSSISGILTSVVGPISAIAEEGKEFRKFKKGIRATKKMARMLTVLAKGVRNMAKMKYEDDEGNVVALTQDDYTQAALNVKAIVTTFMDENIFEDMAGKKFRKAKKGIRLTRRIGKMLTMLADGVKSMATGVYYEYNESGEGKGKKVQIGAPEYKQAALNVKAIISTFMDENIFEDMAGKKFRKAKKGIRLTRRIGKMLTKLAEGVSAMASGKYTDEDGKQVKLGKKQYQEAGANVLALINSVFKGYETFDPKAAKTSLTVARNANTVVGMLIKLSRRKSAFRSIADSMGKISGSFVNMYDAVKDIQVNKIEAAEGLMDSLLEIDKIKRKKFEKNLEAATDFLEKISEIDTNKNLTEVVEKVSEVSSGESGEGGPGGVASKEELDALSNKVDTLIEIMNNNNSLLSRLNSTLSGTINVNNIN